MSKVIVGMSGGVDSAVTAYLLKEQGYDVIGVTLRTWEPDGDLHNRCCEMDDARRVCIALGVPYYPITANDIFKCHVIDPFVDSYLKGKTPNPCIECNRYVKWAKMIDVMRYMGADYIATGHYAYIIEKNDRYTVKTAKYAAKDQTYMLYKLTQYDLAHTLMPLGDYSKDEVRKIAEKAGLPVAKKPDSQEICFIPDDDYAGYINAHLEGKSVKNGNFVDTNGTVIAPHKGIINYTIGQRKGLGIAAKAPLYVQSINAENGDVVLGSNEDLFTNEVVIGDTNYLSIEGLRAGESVRALAKIRYHHAPAAATITGLDDNRAQITFDEPVRAVTPGQSAVFYDDDMCVVGGGIIE